MSPQRIPDCLLTTGCDENAYCCEASDIKLSPGEWPYRLIMLGHTMVRRSLSAIGGFYRSNTDSTCTLMIYND